jgi:uncharacterized membrane protein
MIQFLFLVARSDSDPLEQAVIGALSAAIITVVLWLWRKIFSKKDKNNTDDYDNLK